MGFYWLGVGDLRPYLFVRFFPMLLMPLVFWLYPARTGPVDDGDILVVLGLYGLALVCGRVLDGPLFALGGIISGRQQFSFGPDPKAHSFRRGPPESSHGDVNRNRPKDPNPVSITPMAAFYRGLDSARQGRTDKA